MGIAISELLKLEYFKDFNVIAGKRGLSKEVQGISVLEAPDAARWSRGKELIVSSGYVISKDKNCIQRAFDDGTLLECSGFMIKRGRYLDKIPEDIIELFDKYDIPLISMPFSIPWMELMNKINTTIMNRTIKRFGIQNEDVGKFYDKSYREQKIKRILQAVEVDMKFPAFLYDVAENKSYYSSENFTEISKYFKLKDSDYWNPTKNFTKHTLCDYINMVRYRLVDEDYSEGPRVSWIIMPILMNGIVQSYFVVMESKEFIDFYDEYSIRIAFLMLQNVYEQTFFVRNMGNIGFENYINFAMAYKKNDSSKLFYQASIQGVDIHKRYIFIMFAQENSEYIAREHRKEFIQAIEKNNIYRTVRLAFLEENEGLLLVETKENEIIEKNIVEDFIRGVKQQIESNEEKADFVFSICNDSKTLLDVRENVQKLQRVIKMGRFVYANEFIWHYDKLGPIAWIDIPDKELEKMLKSYKEILKNDKNAEILRTLKIYLESNMNYSITSDKMFAHINTVRKRIERAMELIDIDLDNYVSRLQVIILLQYLNID